jgi:hypothetical protein
MKTDQVKLNEMIKTLKKVLMTGNGCIRLGSHTKERMTKRGYTRGDIVMGIMTGSIVEIQVGFNHIINQQTPSWVIEGVDESGNGIVVVVSVEGENSYSIVTVMPSMDKSRFQKCV